MRPIMNSAPSSSTTKQSRIVSKQKSNKEEVLKILKDPVEVFCRIKTFTDSREICCIKIQSTTSLILFPTDKNKNCKAFQYGFNQIFTQDDDQKDIFNTVAIPLLNGLIKGENGLLFTYGVTGSGKTYTMTGLIDNPGIVPRSINALFNAIEDHQTPKFLIFPDKMNGFDVFEESEALTHRLCEAKLKRKLGIQNDSEKYNFKNDGNDLENVDCDVKYAVFISYVEIYNNVVYDLLEDTTDSKCPQSKILREDCKHNIYVNNVNEFEVKNSKQALILFHAGNKRKRTSATSLNTESSRSHSIFTIRLVRINNIENKERNDLKISQLSLVDLAGSERCDRAQSSNQRLKEACKINNSLMTLRTCLEILRYNQQNDGSRIVPYRESRLTHLFKNYFEGEGKIRMIVCINPSFKDFDENVFVMKFAEIASEVQIIREIQVVRNNDERTDSEEAIKTETDTELEKPRRLEKRFPKIRLLNPESEEIKSLIIYMKRRRATLTNLKKIRHLSDKFRLKLVDLEKERDDYKKQVTTYLPAERGKIKELKEAIINLGYQHDLEKEKCIEKDETIKKLNNTIAEKDMEIKQNLYDRENQQRKIDEISEKLTHELDEKLRYQRNYMKAQIKEKEEKIERVKEILINDNFSKEPSRKSLNTYTDSLKSFRLEEPIKFDQNSTKLDELYIPISSNTDMKEFITNTTCTSFKTNTSILQRKSENDAIKIINNDQLILKSTNSRHRGSRLSSGDVWLEHRAAMPTTLRTVLQPKIKRRKSVSKLTKKGEVVRAGQSKYLLISQNQDEAGDLETKLYKADIIPTCTGGAQVIFDDVEKLKQESPLKESPAKKIKLQDSFKDL